MASHFLEGEKVTNLRMHLFFKVLECEGGRIIYIGRLNYKNLINRFVD